ncbi:MAG: hypothetical protein MRQ10_03970, partial [Candidatus Midichloria mitochondrii]|nr:hypothetical protein [Candidatus Midichloria mitochondrii]MDJ1288372.1 hypothetical protein [Candidatus Midichloria mitochondrii]MDJ1299210.1 hypothetical protein [Candidatus Midichloria mitochondrii]
TAIGELKEICQIQRHGITRQTISWQVSSQGSWLTSSTQYISWKNRLTGILLNVKLRLTYVNNHLKHLCIINEFQ